MFACQGNHEQYDSTERKKQLVFGIEKAKQNKMLSRTIIVFIGCDVFCANDSCMSIGDRGSVADVSGAAVNLCILCQPCLTAVYLQLSKPCLDKILKILKNPVIESHTYKAVGFSLASFLLMKMGAAEMKGSSLLIYRYFMQLVSSPDSSGMSSIKIIHVMKKQALYFLTCHCV